MRPVYTHKVFNLAIDTLTCVWGGLLLPKLCWNELGTALAPYPHLVSFESSIDEDTHLSKDNYFSICSSDKRVQEVGNNACCMVALFAFETLKTHSTYDTIRNEVPVKFLYHLRNASAHGNRFNFCLDRARNRFQDPGVLKWRNKTIDKSLQEHQAFTDFFGAGDFGYLFEDISKIMS